MKKSFNKIIIIFLLIFIIGSTDLAFAAVQDNNLRPVMVAQVSSAVKNIYEQVRNIFNSLQDIIQKGSSEQQVPLPSPRIQSVEPNQPALQEDKASVSQPIISSDSKIKSEVRDKSTDLQSLTNRILDLNQQFQEQSGLVSQKTLLTMLDLAKERKSKLIATLDENPLFALVSLIPGSVISKLPVQVQREFIEKEISLKGVLQITSAANQKVKYSLLVGDKEFKFDPFGVMPKVNSGALVKIEGYEIGDDRIVALVDKNTFQVIAQTSAGSPQNSPLITALVGPTNLRADEAGNWLIKAYHPQGTVLSYSVDWGDGAISIVSDSPLFSRVFSRAGNYNMTFKAIGGGKTVSEIIRLSVVDITARLNRPPKLAQISDRQIRPGDIVKFTINATDPDGDPISYRVSGVENLPGAAFNSRTKTFIWLVPDFLQPGIYEVSFDVSDGEAIDHGKVSFSYGGGGIPTNNPPYFDEIADRVARAGETVSFYINATDPDGDPISYSIASSLPQGASFNSGTRRFTWAIPLSFQSGNYSIIFKANDGVFTGEQTVYVVVIAPTPRNKPPAFSSLMATNISGREGSAINFYLLGSDPDVGDALIYGVDSLPLGANLNSQTGVFSWMPDFNQAGIYESNFTVADRLIGDPERLTDTVKVTIIIANLNRAPVLDEIGNKQINAGNTLTFKVTASDPDNDPITFSASGLSGNATLNESTGDFSWTPQTVGSFSLTISVIDRPSVGGIGASLTDSETVYINVLSGSDITPPTVSITSPISGSTVTSTISVIANATDNVGVAGVQFKLDGANLGVEDTSSPWSVSWNTASSTNGTHNITARARDAVGNFTDSALVTVTVNNIIDSQPPTVSITSPISGSTVTSTISVIANATDNVGVAGVQFKLDGANLGVEVTSSPWSVSWNTASSTNGSHTLTAVARDVVGNQTISSAVNVNVNNPDLTPPSVLITHSPISPSNTQTVVYTASASDTSGIYRIEIYVDNILRQTCNLTITCSFTGGPYASESIHSYYALAKDNSPQQNQGRNPVTGAKTFFIIPPAQSSLIDAMQVQVNEITRQLQEILKKIY
ncbi:MAG: Ig-like domain-containing protein [Patescibacteria group bacterium]|nr:Ig-like domain-containing protein [Patescibacteria group bacterium]